MPIEMKSNAVLTGSAAAPIVLTPTCPMCHTLDVTVSNESLRSGADWTCTRCGQVWSAARLETVAAYELFLESR